MASAVLNLGAFSPAELTELLTAAKAVYMNYLTTGIVKGGGSVAQQYQMERMSPDQVVNLINALTTELGLDTDTLLVRPDFNPADRCAYGRTFGA